MITFEVIDRSGAQQIVEVPEEISLSLMEVLKASDYPVLATCGGMALCATCHVEIEKGLDRLPPPGDMELDMLDQLPKISNESRLACQIRINESLNGAVIRLGAEDYAG
jgi:2Fe-2S ferredoxin